jgi:hypothetical protein
MPSPPYSVQRMHPRLRGRWPVRWAHDWTRSSVAVDLSLGGCRVADPAMPPTLGARVWLRLHFAADDLLDVRAAVVWVALGREFGLRFVDLTPEQTAHLVRLLMRDGLVDPFRPSPFDAERGYGRP